MLSPNSFRILLNFHYLKIENLFQRKCESFFCHFFLKLLITIFLVVIFFKSQSRIASDFFNFLQFEFVRLPSALLIVGILTSGFKKIISRNRELVLIIQSYIFIIVAFSFWNYELQLDQLCSAIAITIGFHLMTQSLALGLRKFQTKKIIFLAPSILLFILFTLYIQKIFPRQYFSLLVLNLRWLMPFTYLFDNSRKASSTSAIFNPTNLYFPTSQLNTNTDHCLRSQNSGLFDSLKIAFHMLVLILIMKLFYMSENWNFFLKGALYYLTLYTISYIGIGASVAFLRLMGFKMDDPFNFALISTNPTQRWKNWNTYYFDWFFKFIYFPTFRFTKNFSVATICVFILTFVIHTHLSFLSQSLNVYMESLLLLNFFMLNSFFIILFNKYPKIFGNEQNISGWIGFVINFTLMSLSTLIIA